MCKDLGTAARYQHLKEHKTTMTQTYRLKRNRDTWHFCRNCRHWPKSNYESSKETPKSGNMVRPVQRKTL